MPAQSPEARRESDSAGVDPGLSAADRAGARRQLPLLAELLALRRRSDSRPRRGARLVVGAEAAGALPPLGRFGRRSGAAGAELTWSSAISSSPSRSRSRSWS